MENGERVCVYVCACAWRHMVPRKEKVEEGVCLACVCISSVPFRILRNTGPDWITLNMCVSICSPITGMHSCGKGVVVCYLCVCM